MVNRVWYNTLWDLKSGASIFLKKNFKGTNILTSYVTQIKQYTWFLTGSTINQNNKLENYTLRLLEIDLHICYIQHIF